MALYAVPAWATNLKVKENQLLQQAQRRALILTTGAYKTAPTIALQVIAGHLPIDLQIQLTVAKYNLKRGMPARVGDSVLVGDYAALIEKAQEAAMDAWQRRWDDAENGRLTHEFFPNVRG